MSDAQDNSLFLAVSAVVAKVRRFSDRSMGEQNTKASLVEPILEALGWDVRDPDEVYREYKPKSVDNPVDYALTILRKPRLFVEAKGLGEQLSNRRWITQVLSYASVAGVEWCVLTDGDEYRFYNAMAPLDAEERLFCKLRLSESDEKQAAQTLRLISRANMEGNLLDALWTAYFVDRRVKQVIQNLFQTQDRSLIRLIQKRDGKLSPRDIIDSIRRLELRFESFSFIPTSPRPLEPPPAAKRKGSVAKSPKARPKSTSKQHYGVNLADLIEAGVIQTPMRLFRRYKGTLLEATLSADGSVEFQGRMFPSCSTAAEFARSSITGRRMNTNGWVFWQTKGPSGTPVELKVFRDRYLEGNPDR